MPDCSFEELIPIFSTRYSGDHIWLGVTGRSGWGRSGWGRFGVGPFWPGIWLGDPGRSPMKRYGISRLGSQITPGEFTTHGTVSSQSSHYNHLSNPSFMYCRTYVSLYDAVQSVIPCDKLHKHQFSFNNDGEQRASFGWEREFQYGATFLYHGTGNQLRVYFTIFSDSWYHASDKFSSLNWKLASVE